MKKIKYLEKLMFQLINKSVTTMKEAFTNILEIQKNINNDK